MRINQSPSQSITIKKKRNFVRLCVNCAEKEEAIDQLSIRKRGKRCIFVRQCCVCVCLPAYAASRIVCVENHIKNELIPSKSRELYSYATPTITVCVYVNSFVPSDLQRKIRPLRTPGGRTAIQGNAISFTHRQLTDSKKQSSRNFPKKKKQYQFTFS